MSASATGAHLAQSHAHCSARAGCFEGSALGCADVQQHSNSRPQPGDDIRMRMRACGVPPAKQQ